MQPVLLTAQDHNPNGASVRFLIDGAPVPADAASYQRIVLLFDGEDDEAVAAARTRWTRSQGAGLRGDLLAGRRERPLAEEGLKLSSSMIFPKTGVHFRDHAYTSARMRAGPPVASFTLGSPATSVAPVAGTLSRLAMFSMPQRPAGSQV